MDEFVADGLGKGSGIIPNVPPHTGVGSPPFVVRFCQETHDNKLLAVADEEGVVTVVDASRCLPGFDIDPHFRPVHQWVAHDNAIFDVAWCRGDQRMLTASGDQTVRLWDVETAVAHCSFRRHQGSVKAVSVCPDGHRGGGGAGDVFASCGRDGTIALWDARDSRRRRYGGGDGTGADGEPTAVPTAVIERAHEPPSAMGGGTARGFRTRTDHGHHSGRGGSGAGGGRATRSTTRRVTDNAAIDTPASGARAGARAGGRGGGTDGGAIASQDQPGDAIGTQQVAGSSREHRAASVVRGVIQHSVTSVVFAHDGQVLVSAGAADGIVKLWDVRQLSRGMPVAEIADSDPPPEAGGTNPNWFHGGGPRRRGRGVTALALAPGGSSRIAAAYSDSHLAIFDLHAPAAGPIAHLRGHRAPSFYVKAAFSPEGTHVASGSCDQHVYVWQLDRPREPPSVLRGHSGEVTAVDWCPSDFTCLASCADDDTARVWTIDRRDGGGGGGGWGEASRGMVGGVRDREREGGREHRREGGVGWRDSREDGGGSGVADDELGFEPGVFRTPSAAREPAVPPASARTKFSGGEWLARAIEEGRRLSFETPMPTFRGGGEGIEKAGNKENVDCNDSGKGFDSLGGGAQGGAESGATTASTYAAATAAATSPAPLAAALVTPGPGAARRGAARRPLRVGAAQSNSILTYFAPQHGGGAAVSGIEDEQEQEQEEEGAEEVVEEEREEEEEEEEEDEDDEADDDDVGLELSPMEVD
jgi:denticleless